jgi:hypothetical protein
MVLCLSKIEIVILGIGFMLRGGLSLLETQVTALPFGIKKKERKIKRECLNQKILIIFKK